MTGSNRRPPACKAGALPAELIPQSSRVTTRLNQAVVKSLVGLEGLEPSTPALSRRCSNHLSYRPDLDLRSQQPISVNTQLPVHALERR